MITGSTTTCRCRPVCDTRFGGTGGRSPSTAVVEALAAAEGVAPMELEQVTGQVDLDALDDLFENSAGGETSSVVFRARIHGWNVFVRGDGAVRVCDPDPATERAAVFDRPVADS